MGSHCPLQQHLKCMCCKMIGKENVGAGNGLPLICSPGNCKIKNTIHLVFCQLCYKSYIGRTVQTLDERMSGHRKNFYKILPNEDVDETRDDYSSIN